MSQKACARGGAEVSELGRRVLEEEMRSYPEVTVANGVYTQNHGHRVNEYHRDFSPTIARTLGWATVVTLGWMKRIGLNSSIMSRFLFLVSAMAVGLWCPA